MANKSVVISGCSTGIGRAAALRFDRLGWRVFAGVRKEADGEALSAEASSRLRPLMLDVTDDASRKEAAEIVAEATGGRLDGLVNNAGISVQGPLEYLPLDDLRWQFEVNVTGQVATTQAFMPSLRTARGRIVFIGSVAGRAPTPPFLAPYGGSKKAIEAIAEALRHELYPWRMFVSVIEPGSVATDIWEKGDSTFDGMIEALPPDGRERYEKSLLKARKFAQSTGARGIPADKVADRIEHALTSKRPRLRYLMGVDAYAQTFVGRLAPVTWRSRAVGKMLGYERRT